MPDPVLTLVSWNLTRRCNLACGHCYLDAVSRKSAARDELDAGETLCVVRQIAEAAPGAMLVLTGGEPLLRPDLPAIVAEAAERGLMPVIGTNGVLLDAERAGALRAAGAVGVGISLDSATPRFHDTLRGMAGAWNAALAGAAAARGAGLAVQLQSTLFRENRGDLDALADRAQTVGAMALNFFFLVCTGRGVTQTDMPQRDYEDTLARIARLQEERPHLMIRARCAPYMRRMLSLRAGEGSGSYTRWSSACLAGRSYLRITPQGQVTPCPYIPEAVGELRKHPLKEVWESSATLRRLRSELPGGKCGDCDFRLSCGGCRARAAAAHGDLMAEDPKCGYIRPPGAMPEAALRAGPDAVAIPWTAEAQALLNCIPGFVRERVRERIEQAAATEAVTSITVEFMRAHRPPMPAGILLRTTTRS